MSMDMYRRHEAWGELDPATEKEGFGQCLWNIEANKTFRAAPKSGATTVLDALEKTKEQFGARRAAGWREVVKVHQIPDSGGVLREKIELANEYTWMTYSDYFSRVMSLAGGFASAGLEPKDRLVIYAETQRDWMVSAFAAFCNNATVVTIYATLGEEGAVHGINESGAKIVVADARLLKVLAKALPKCPSVKTVVTITAAEDAMAEKVTSCNVALHAMEDLIAVERSSPFTTHAPTPDDVAVIMYTSGTTGAPKGVMLKHSNIVAVVAGVEHAMLGCVDQNDVYLSYLPLAHIMEMAAEIAFMSFGAALGFGSPHTLTDSAVKLKRPESMGDAPLLGPSFMVFAPAVLDKVYSAVNAKKQELGTIGQTLFDWGLASGERHFNRGKVGANRFFNGLVFKKVQKLLGGNLKAMITGSAPLSPDIQRFIQTVLDVPVRQGYGLTETCAGSCVAFWGDNSVSSVGPPTVCAVIRLADWPEGSYMNADKDKEEIGMRRGEVLIGGPAVSAGYFISEVSPNEELKKKNAEEWVEIDGIRFFRTGDIGQIKPDGTLQIIDRKKDLWKGPNGEYVAFTKVEAALQLSEYVEVPMVYGRTGAEYPVALLCPSKPKLLALGQELGVAGEDMEQLCKNEQVIQKVAESCKAVCKQKKLLDFETPKKFALVADPWTPENDMLTAALKLKRPLIAQRHKADIDHMYA